MLLPTIRTERKKPSNTISRTVVCLNFPSSNYLQLPQRSSGTALPSGVAAIMRFHP